MSTVRALQDHPVIEGFLTIVIRLMRIPLVKAWTARFTICTDHSQFPNPFSSHHAPCLLAFHQHHALVSCHHPITAYCTEYRHRNTTGTHKAPINPPTRYDLPRPCVDA